MGLRVGLVFDMEAASQVEDLSELYPSYEAYWRSGRRKLTSDVAAAARGLLHAGASQVDVLNHHGAGAIEWPNLIGDELPPGATVVDEWDQVRRADAIFQVGCHARGGSQSFSSHTILPGLRLRLDGELLSESHWWALNAALPVLGIVGSEALGADLGFLSGVPFLAVQGGDTRARPRPLFATQEESAAAIEAFASDAYAGATMQRAFAPRDCLLEASLQNGDEAAPALEAAGWTRTSRTEFKLEAPRWRDGGDPVGAAIDAAVEATWAPYAWLFTGLDPSTEATSREYPRASFAADDAVLQAWHAERTAEWITPEHATRREGLPAAQPLAPPGAVPSV